MLFLATDDLMAEVKGAMSRPVTAELKAQHEQLKAQITDACKLGELTCGVAIQHAERSRILSVTGSSAEIMISGALVKELSFWAWIMGATTYAEISSAAEALAADDEIQEVNLRIGSGGGTVEGMIACSNALQALRDKGKLKVTYVDGVCGSAAYGLGAQAENMIALSAGEIVGSVGAMTYRVKYNEVQEIAIRGENSQDKNADAFTEAGLKIVQEEVNDFEAMYLDMVAKGRGVSVETVKANYGNGKIMSAQRALDCGMIDAIASQSGTVTGGAPTNLTAQGKTEHQPTANSEDIMNKAELQAKHPELYSSLKSEFMAAGKEEGKADEQKRVSALAEAGESFGAQELAMACIKDGTEIDASLQLRFASAQAKNQGLNAMGADNVETDDVKKPEAPKETTFEDDIAAAMDEDRGEFY